MQRLLPEPAELVTITTAGDAGLAGGDKSRWVGRARGRPGGRRDRPRRALGQGRPVRAGSRDRDRGHAAAGRPAGRAGGREAARRRARGARGWGPARCAAAPSCWPCGPTCSVVELRGNVDTRLRKLAAGEVEVLVLAAAGLDRLDRRREAGGALFGDVFVPAPGQGVIAVQAREGSPAADVAASVSHGRTMACLRAERAAVRELAASCHTPVGIHADGVTIRGFAGLPDGSEWIVDEVPMDDGDAALDARPAHARRRRRRPPARRRGDGRAMTGIVHLVGAGPGDPGLLTVRAVELLGAADVVLYDRLIPPEALAHARPGAELVYVGKEGEGPQFPQDDTHRLLLEHARAGRRVVRLKGGDPFVFGRGGEEALVLARGRHPVRGRARRDGRRRRARLRRHPRHAPRRRQRRGVRHRPRGPGPSPESGDRLGRAAPLPRHARLLHGRPQPAQDRRAADRRGPAAGRAGRRRRARHPPRPAHAARHARRTSPSAPRRSGSARRRSRSSARSPACASSSPGSRRGRCTAAPSRSRARARRRARSRRACAPSAPRWSRRRRSGSRRWRPQLPPLDGYDLVCVTSPNGADLLLDRLRDARELAGITVAAIGPGTARALRARGVEPDVVPERAVAEGLVEALARHAGAARADRPRRRGPRRAARRAARARRRGRRRGALRDRRRAARRRRARRPPRRPTTCSSRPRPRCASSTTPPARSTGRGWSRSAPPPAPSCAPTAPSPTSRPTPTRPTASSRRCSRTPPDDAPDHLPVGLRARPTSSSASSTA